MEVRIKNKVKVEWQGDEGHWELLEDLKFTVDGERFMVPRGFHSDLASIPRVFRSVTPQVGKHIPIAIVHDFIYRTSWVEIPRKKADEIFLAGMEHLGVWRGRRYAMYSAVRAGGWLSYKERTHYGKG